MVKLVTARESRMYGGGKRRGEYTNAGAYLFSTVILGCGFVAQLSKEPKSGLVVLLIGLGFIAVVNIHDLIAHLPHAPVKLNYHLFRQLVFVDFVVPLLHAFGAILFFISILLILLQVDRGFGYHRIEAHALNLLIAGASLWVVASIHNSCQVYESADANLQMLQHTVQIPFLMASFLFLFGAIVNFIHQVGQANHGLNLLSYAWVWISIVASLFLIFGGLANVVKVVKMLETDGIKLEKHYSGVQEHLILIQEE